jgi:hypothetical protein
MTRYIFIILFFTTVLTLGACASVPNASPDLDLKVKHMTPPVDKALLYVYGAGDDLKIDGNFAGFIRYDQYLAWLLEPGRHGITSKIGTIRLDTSIEAKAGMTYYVTMPSKLELIATNSHLGLVDKNTGQKDLEGLHLAFREGEAEQVPTISAIEKASSAASAATTASSPVAAVKMVSSDIDELPQTRLKANKKSYAVVIGIEQYRQKLPQADFATQDAKSVAEYLTKVMGYPDENVVTLTNDHAALGDFVKYFEKWLPNNVDEGSTVFVYYSGHGAPNPKTSDAYIVPYDGDPSFIDETGYPLKRMYAALDKLPAKEVIVALDSCFSGAGGRSVLAKGARPIVLSVENPVLLSKKITVLSASGGDQISSTYDEKGHGLFTYFMLKGIKNEDVVRPDGSIKLDDLFGYVKPQVERIARKQYNNEQTPQMIGKKQ